MIQIAQAQASMAGVVPLQALIPVRPLTIATVQELPVMPVEIVSV